MLSSACRRVPTHVVGLTGRSLAIGTAGVAGGGLALWSAVSRIAHAESVASSTSSRRRVPPPATTTKAKKDDTAAEEEIEAEEDKDDTNALYLFQVLVRSPINSALRWLAFFFGFPTLGVLWLLIPYLDWEHLNKSVSKLRVPSSPLALGKPQRWRFDCDIMDYYRESSITFLYAVGTMGLYTLFGLHHERRARFLDAHIIPDNSN